MTGDALFRLDGAVALVVGGGGALGGAMAGGLAGAGAAVVVADLPGSNAPVVAERLLTTRSSRRPAAACVGGSACSGRGWPWPRGSTAPSRPPR